MIFILVALLVLAGLSTYFIVRIRPFYFLTVTFFLDLFFISSLAYVLVASAHTWHMLQQEHTQSLWVYASSFVGALLFLPVAISAGAKLAYQSDKAENMTHTVSLYRHILIVLRGYDYD